MNQCQGAGLIIAKAFLQVILLLLRTIDGIKARIIYALNATGGHTKLVFEEYEGSLDRPTDIRRAVVIALYPNENNMPFTINLMKGFTNAGFFVLGVSAKILPMHMREQLSANCHHIIERSNVGHDFGSYQAGVFWIQQQSFYTSLDTLAIANDSMFYGASITGIINDILCLPGEWFGLFANYYMGLHVQSFFEIFHKSVLQSEAFRSFWAKYKPLSSRVHTICKGEVGLSSALLKAGFNPSVLYSGEVVKRAVISRLSTDPHDMDVLHALVLKVDEKKPTPFVLGVYPPIHVLTKEIGRIAENCNPTHSFGLLCNTLFEAPIKCDLAFRGTATIADILTCAKGYSDKELEAMRRLLHCKGIPASISKISWTALKKKAGIV